MGQLEQAEGPSRLAWRPGEDSKNKQKTTINKQSNKKIRKKIQRLMVTHLLELMVGAPKVISIGAWQINAQ